MNIKPLATSVLVIAFICLLASSPAMIEVLLFLFAAFAPAILLLCLIFGVFALIQGVIYVFLFVCRASKGAKS